MVVAKNHKKKSMLMEQNKCYISQIIQQIFPKSETIPIGVGVRNRMYLIKILGRTENNNNNTEVID